MIKRRKKVNIQIYQTKKKNWKRSWHHSIEQVARTWDTACRRYPLGVSLEISTTPLESFHSKGCWPVFETEMSVFHLAQISSTKPNSA